MNVDIIDNIRGQNILRMDTTETVSIISTQSHQSESVVTRSRAAMELRAEGMRANSQICLNVAHDTNKTKISVENRLTRISLGIVYLFIICHIWRLIPTVYEALFSEDDNVISKWPNYFTCASLKSKETMEYK